MSRETSTKELLLVAAGFVDTKYIANRQWANFNEYITNYELEIALDSLLELADEVEGHFEYGFWHNLEQAATKMKLFNHQKIIEQKISKLISN